MEPKRLIEAALFMSGREMSVPELKKLTGIASAGHIKEIVEGLIEEYASMGSSLEIFEGENAYLMRVRDEYAANVRQFAQDVAISKSALRTLSYVARHNGILKSVVVKRIGTAIYDDVRELVENGFILQRKYGRSSKLFLTDKFRAYFEKGEALPKAPAPAAGASSKEADSPSKEPSDSAKEDSSGASSKEDSPDAPDEPSSGPAVKKDDFSFSDMDESGEEKFED